MFKSVIILSFLIICVHSGSILNRYFREEAGDPIAADPYEDDRVSDADVGMKSARYVGTFNGRPIESRQENTFIDQDGVPVPMLPYQKEYKNSANLSTLRHFLERSRAGPV